jgi:hypothetical protein
MFTTEHSSWRYVVSVMTKGAGQSSQGMAQDCDSPSRWWALAAEARAVAAEMTDPQARKVMLKIAEGYEHLARRAEARQKGST